MSRFMVALALFSISGCASAPPKAVESPQAVQAKADAGQAYQSLQVQEVEQQMLYQDNVLTYAYAVVSCGLRAPQWFAVVRDIYARDYAAELQQVPLNAAQNALALGYANAHVENPSPPPYICGRLKQDSTLAALDEMVGLRSAEIVASAK